MDRQGPAEGIPAGGRQDANDQPEGAGQGPEQPGQSGPDERARELAVEPLKQLIAAIAREGHGETAAAHFAAEQMVG